MGQVEIWNNVRGYSQMFQTLMNTKPFHAKSDKPFRAFLMPKRSLSIFYFNLLKTYSRTSLLVFCLRPAVRVDADVPGQDQELKLKCMFSE